MFVTEGIAEIAEPPLGTLTTSSGQGLIRFVQLAGRTSAPCAVAVSIPIRESSACPLAPTRVVKRRVSPGAIRFVPKWSDWPKTHCEPKRVRIRSRRGMLAIRRDHQSPHYQSAASGGAFGAQAGA